MKRILALAVLVILAGRAARAGLPPKMSTASPSQLVMAVCVQDTTVRVGGPLLLRGVLYNATDESCMVPVRPPEELLLEGLLSYAVIDKSGMRYQYRPYLYASSYWLWDDCTQVGRRDSLYWHQLLPLDHFFRGRNRLNASPGEYRLVVSLQLPRFHEDLDARSEWFTLSDTAVFVLRLDRRLVRDLRPYLGILSAGLWNGFGYEEAAGVERTLRTLDARPSHLDTSFPYLSFVSPRARARALRVQDAIAEAQKFVEDHPRTALAEELEFDLLGLLEEPAFQGKLGPPDVARLQSKADSLRAALLRTYPGNMRAASMMMRGNAGK